MIVKMLIINIITIRFIQICSNDDINNIYLVIIMVLPLSYPISILLISSIPQIWMNLMVLMLMMSIMTIMTMMIILMMILMMIMIIRRIAIVMLVLLPPTPDQTRPGQAGPDQTRPDPKRFYGDLVLA